MSSYADQPKINALYAEMESLTQQLDNLSNGGPVNVTVGMPPGSMPGVIMMGPIIFSTPSEELVTGLTKAIVDRQAAIGLELKALGVDEIITDPVRMRTTA
jgi:hypothetical protein